MLRQTTIITQQPIIDLGIALGYGPQIVDGVEENIGISENGICAGVGLMGVLACLAGNRKKFNLRLKLINKRKTTLVASILQAEKQLASAAVQRRLAILTKENNEFPAELVNTKNLLLNLTLLELRMFIEGICAIQNFEYSSEVLEQEINVTSFVPILNLICPIEIKNKGGIVCVFKSNRIFSVAELHTYLTLLDQAAQYFKCPIAVPLINEDHVIAIHYNAKRKYWNFIDSSTMPIKSYTADQLAPLIAQGLFTKSAVGFSMSILTTGENRLLGYKVAKAFTGLLEAHSLSNITQAQARLTTATHLTLLWLAAEQQDHKLIDQLVSLGSPLNTFCNDISPLMLASNNGDGAALRKLIAAKADLYLVSQSGKSAFITAVHSGCLEAVKAFVSGGFNLEHIRSIDYPTEIHMALDIAEQQMNVKLLTYLSSLDQRSMLRRELDALIMRYHDPIYQNDVMIAAFVDLFVASLLFAWMTSHNVNSTLALLISLAMTAVAVGAGLLIAGTVNYYQHQSFTLFSTPRVSVSDTYEVNTLSLIPVISPSI